MRDIMNRLLGDLESGNDLPVSVDRDRGFQESFSGFAGSPGIIRTCIGAGKPRRIDRGTRDSLTPVVKLFNEPVEEPGERRGSDSLTELMDRREMRYFIEMDLLPK